MESLSTDWKYRGVLDDITELRTFVRIVATRPPPPPRGVFRLVLLVSGWRRWSSGPRAPFRHQHMFKRAERIATEVDEAEAALSRNRGASEGLLRVSAPCVLADA